MRGILQAQLPLQRTPILLSLVEQLIPPVPFAIFLPGDRHTMIVPSLRFARRVEQTVCADPGNMSGYTYSSGTSLSTPLVGGASGILLSAHPNWTNMMVREALMMTATKTDSVSSSYGWGIIDVGRALYYHPAGDIVFDFKPLLGAASGQPININIHITGGTGIASASIFWRAGNDGDFDEMPLVLIDSANYAAQIPGQSDSLVQFYFKAIDNGGSFAYYPVGGEMHPYSVGLGLTQFVDTFDDGLLYWESGGIKNAWGPDVKYAHSGMLSVTDSPTEDYKNGVDSWLRSTFVLNLTQVSSATISFYWRGIMQSGHDSLHVEASTDGGNNWSRVGPSLYRDRDVICALLRQPGIIPWK